MVGMAFASVPLYRLFCQVTGLAGTTQQADAAPAATIDREVYVRFDANVGNGLGWSFRPLTRSVEIKVGEVGEAVFVGREPDRPTRTTGTAVFNVTPLEAGAYFNKIACFCFERADAPARPAIEMPVTFFVDPAIADDPDLDHVRTITLSYTFYPVEPAGRGYRPAATAPSDAGVHEPWLTRTRPSHPYHLVKPSPWPLVGAISAFCHGARGNRLHARRSRCGGCVPGFLGVLYTMLVWWRDVIHEGQEGDHTPVVQLGLRYGMILFIASEVMFFVAWFWAFFNSALNLDAGVEIVKDAFTGGVWPPKGIEVFDPWHLPLLNTLILLTSGTTVTWAHHALIHNDRKGLVWGLVCTIVLGIIFTSVQAYEYAHAPFSFGGNIYGATFFMATGFHGFHVIVGTIFLIVCLIRAIKGHFTPKAHFGFEAAAWYWHFVDVVWIFLFFCIYVWGGWGAPIARQ